jgi:ABC-type nickel/cobalt efflux system permease component RcnA
MSIHMPVMEIVAGSGLGSLLGMRHALEPDHLAAVSTLVSDERGSVRAAWLGACWGLGHTFSLIVAGVALMALRAEMPAGAANFFELAVALMLVALGTRSIRQALRRGADGPLHAHHHGRLVHAHHASVGHVHVGPWTLARRPLLIGAIHGLAGSGALTALVLATLPSTAARVAYMGLFGIGSTVGMAALSGVLGWPLARLGARPRVARAVRFTVGATSVALGLAYGIPIVMVG